MAALGEILRDRELVSAADINAALLEQKNSKSRLGDILVGQGKIGMFTLYQAIADMNGLPYVNLLTLPPDEMLLDAAALPDYLRLRALPWRKDGHTVSIAASDISEALHAWATTQYGTDYRLVMTSPFDIRSSIEHSFGARLEAESRNHLLNAAPQQSARDTFKREQKIFFLTLLALAAACLAAWPARTTIFVIASLHVLYATTTIFKWLVFRIGLKAPPSGNPLLSTPLPADETLPVYTLLLPMYKEKESLPRLMQSIAALDYPASRLDIKLVLEADDAATVQAAMAYKPTWNVDIIRVPPSQPRTKPKALNYALRFARGEYVTVFDAEDAPDPLQLKKAVAAFRALPPRIVCAQARLNYYNSDENLLTRWFAIEYGILFDALLPGLQALQIPIPLGGTSNHLSLARLRSVGEWDPYNVTEDADLGVRLAARGLGTTVIDSLTLEESPSRLGPWVRQRSRWIKGYMQTWLVHMRDPVALWRALGAQSFLGFQFFMGLSCVSFLSAPLVWTLSILAWGGVESVRSLVFPPWMQPLAMTNLLLHFIAHWAQCSRVLPKLPGYTGAKWKFRIAAAVFPFYWVLHSVASYKSLWQLLVKPHFWEKTSHGMRRKRP